MTCLHTDELSLQGFYLLVPLLAETHEMRAALLGRGHLRLLPAHGVLQVADLDLAVLEGKSSGTFEDTGITAKWPHPPKKRTHVINRTGRPLQANVEGHLLYRLVRCLHGRKRAAAGHRLGPRARRWARNKA